MKPPLEIPLHKAPASMGRSESGKTLWSTGEHGPWVEVEPAAKAYLESRGWDVEYGIIGDAQSVIYAALFTIFSGEKNPLGRWSFISSGQLVNRVDGIAGHMFDAKDKDVFAKVQKAFGERGIDLEGPLQLLKLVVFSSKKYNDQTVKTQDIFFGNIGKYLHEDMISAFRPSLEKWINLYTRKARKPDTKKGFRFANVSGPIDPDYVLLRLVSFIRSGDKVDFIGYGDIVNAAQVKSKLNEYKRDNRNHHTMYNRGRNISKPAQIPSTDEAILESEGFKERYGDYLKALYIDDKTIAKWRKLIANVGMERLLRIILGDHEKWSRTLTWFAAGEGDLFISNGGFNYFCEVKSPNDRVHQSQRDFMAYVAKSSGIDYIICKVKPLA